MELLHLVNLAATQASLPTVILLKLVKHAIPAVQLV